MPVQVRLRQDQLRELSIIRDLGAETIQTIIDKITKLDPPPILLSELQKVFKDILSSQSAGEIDAVMGQVLSLYTLRRELLSNLVYAS